MAQPTDVRVESKNPTNTDLYWSDNGGASNRVYRSTNGSSYSLITTVALGEEYYRDEDLSIDTKYWYKLSNDAGVGFSDVVTVYTHKARQVATTRTRYPQF